ncbi:IPT/TIG domain-containing protein [Candidatus Binatia bacterium]|nr:IPT/TIG domain-containing protein [Candidatus Binatia bacterium]
MPLGPGSRPTGERPDHARGSRRDDILNAKLNGWSGCAPCPPCLRRPNVPVKHPDTAERAGAPRGNRRHAMPSPRTTRSASHAALLGLVAALSTATSAMARPVTAYVVNYASDSVTPIDLSTGTPGAPIPVGAGPTAIAITPDASKAYVANGSAHTVTPIDLATNTAGSAIPVGFQPFSIAITSDGRTAWVANYGNVSSDPVNGPFPSITSIDTVTDKAGPTIQVPNPEADISSARFVNVSPDGTTLYLTGERLVTPFDLVSGTFGTPIYNTPKPTASLLSVDGAHLLTANTWGGGIERLELPGLTKVSPFSLPYPLIAAGNNDLALTPDGAKAYVGYVEAFGGGVIPLDLGTGVAGTKIPLGGVGGAVAITPDGATVIVARLFDQSVRLVSTATNTAGATIPVGNQPGAIAVTPDQAPIARLTVTRAPAGSPTTFDASASTVAFGTVASYAWDFGDGTTDVTTTPITTHTYTGGSYTASVTLTSSAGTSTGRVFNGQTTMRNGGPQARATSLGSLALLGAPVVSQLIPAAGLVAGGTTVNIIGSGFTGVTSVTFGGVPAVSFTVNGDNSITAIAPAALGAATVDVSVANVLGVSAVTPADQFKYLGSVPGVTVACPAGGCIAVFPTASGMTVSASSPTGCAVCNIVGGIEPLGGLNPKCPGGAAPQMLPAGWVDASQNGGAFSQIAASVSYAMTSADARENGNLAWFKLVSVCFVNGVPTPVSPLSAGGPAATVAAAPEPPKAVKLKACSKKKPVPPCVLGKTVVDGVAHASMLLPASGGTFRVVTPEVKIRRLKPDSASPGATISIMGSNMNAVTGVLIGGAEAPITSRTKTKLQVTVPDAVGSGDVTVLTLSGAVAAPKPLTLAP